MIWLGIKTRELDRIAIKFYYYKYIIHIFFFLNVDRWKNLIIKIPISRNNLTKNWIPYLYCKTLFLLLHGPLRDQSLGLGGKGHRSFYCKNFIPTGYHYKTGFQGATQYKFQENIYNLSFVCYVR